MSSPISPPLLASRPFRRRFGLWCIVGGLLWGPLPEEPLDAQYIAPGTGSTGGGIPTEDDLRTSLEEARWQVGGLRLDPWIGLRDGGLVSTVDEQREETDFTATFGAGIRAYVKNGRRVIWAAHALPEYVWWEDTEEKRSFNGRFGLGLFTYFNRLTLEASLRSNERQGFFSSEIQELTTTRENAARLAFDLEAVRRVFLFGSYTSTDFDNQESESSRLSPSGGTPFFAQLDREEESTRIGLAYRSPRGFSFGAGLESTDFDFDADARDLSNTAEGGFVAAGWDRRRLAVDLSLELLDREPRAGSSFQGFETLTGFLGTNWELHRSASLLVYARRNVQFSVSESSSAIVAERYGAGLRLGGGRGLTLDLLAEAGEDDFENRLDEVLAYGVSLAFPWREITVQVAVLHTEYDSSLPELDRDVTTANVNIELLGFLQRKLRFGEGDRVW